MRRAARLRGMQPGRAFVVAVLIGLVGCAPAPAATDAAPTNGPAVSQPAGPVIGEDISALTSYASDHADEFAGLYMHPPGSGSFVMLFTANLEAHAASVARIASNVTVRGAQFTEAELIEMLDAVMRSLQDVPGVEPISGSVDTRGNRVTLDVKTDDPTFELRTELQYGGRLDVTVYPVPGPWANVEAGPGWRLLAALESSHSEAHTVRAATDAAALDALWDAIGATGAPPEVDFDSEVVVAFLHGIGSSCPELRLDGVAIGDGEVMSVTSDPLQPRVCTADLRGSVVFVVALERSALPADGFTLWLSRDAKAYTQPVDVELP